MPQKKYRDILVFTDLTPGNVLFLIALKSQYPFARIQLVIGESADPARLVELASCLGFNGCIVGEPSTDVYPTIPLPVHTSPSYLLATSTTVNDAIRDAEAVVAIKPPRELMNCTEVFKADFFMLGGENIYCLNDPERQAPSVILRRCFPNRFVWVEPCDAIGGDDAVEDIGLTGVDLFDQVRMGWNASMREQCLRNIASIVHSSPSGGGHFHDRVSTQEVSTIAEDAKLAERIIRSPYQFTMKEFLVFMAMQGMYVCNSGGEGIIKHGASFSANCSFICEVMGYKPHIIRRVARTMIGDLLF